MQGLRLRLSIRRLDGPKVISWCKMYMRTEEDRPSLAPPPESYFFLRRRLGSPMLLESFCIE